jgi:hypothetical protein
MSLPTDARAALANLKADLDTAAKTNPKLRCVLIEAPDEGIDKAKALLRGRIREFTIGENGLLVFIDDDVPRGVEAYELFCPLAESAVEILTACKVLFPTEASPKQTLSYYPEAKKSHYAKQWMLFVHGFAKAHPGGFPRSASAPWLENEPLGNGAVVQTLSHGVVEASSLVIEQILESAKVQAPQAGANRKRGKAGEAAERIIAALQALAHKGDWNASEIRIIATAGVPKSTYYSVLGSNEAVKKARELYGSKRLGRGPVRADDL